MLNRRSLRVKGMQAIFAYHTAKSAEYNICMKKAQDIFLPDLNSMEVQDKEALAEYRKEVAQLFEQKHEGIGELEATIDEIQEVVDQYYKEYLEKVTASRLYFKKRMLADLSAIHVAYIKLLVLSVKFEKLSTEQKERKNISKNNFSENPVLLALKSYEKLDTERARKNIDWEEELVNSWLKEVLQKEEFYQQYDKATDPSFEENQEFIQAIYKQVVFKNENMVEYFESNDIGWVENKPILKSMVLKTLKSIEAEGEEPLLLELSKNWEEDLEFVKELYDLAIDNEEKLEEQIKEKSKNWEIDRVALTDKIILEMAMSELTNFPSIPVKVTINEYIELSKNYSTPKSKQFVNGLLDVLSVDLQKKGLIRKSGRGLLDNK